MAGSDTHRRIGLIGAGGISRLHLEGIGRHPDRAQAVAICDPNAEMLRQRATEHGIEQTYETLDAMIADAGLDAAIVCTPTHIRSDVVLPLVEAGIPVLCEKPFAETYAEAAEMAAAAREHGVPVAVNQNFRHHFTFTLARELLDGGRLGRPVHLTQIAGHLRRDTGWRLGRRRYVMAVMSIHWLDGYRVLFGQEPETIYCRAVNSPATPGGDDTAVSVVLQFPDGAMASLCESFSSFTRISACGVDCERGGLRLGYKALEEIREGAEPVEHANPFDKAEATWFLLGDLLRAADEGRAPETSATDNLNSMRILEAAYRSAAEGCAVSVTSG